MKEDKREILKRRVYNIREGVCQIPYFKNMPCKIETVDEGRVQVVFYISKELCNYRGIAAGGILAAFCDTLMGMASRSKGYQVTTLEINMNYIRPVHPGQELLGIGEVIHHGGRTIVAEATLMDADGNAVVKGRSSFYILCKYED